MPKTACFFGMGCTKPDCAFQHPRGFKPMCRHGADCKRASTPQGCHFRHVAKATTKAKAMCRFGAECKRRRTPQGCAFRHPGHRPWTDKKSVTKSHVVTVGCTQRDLFLMLDLSGSMAGGPVRDLQVCATDLVQSLVKKGDRLEMTTFSSRVHAPVLPLAPLDRKAFARAVVGMQAGGMTALWRSVITAVDRAAEVYERKKKRFVEVVLMTDGDDTCDPALFEQARLKVAKPGCVLKFFVVSCGSSPATRRQLEQLCAPAHCKLFMEDDVTKLREAFGKVKRELVSVTTTETARVVRHVKTQVRRKRLS